ncbi:MBL fold metallo-hydrolase [Actinomadura rupiterrae]|uniref:MBL fold metallo-hydrolase n=1 Tax=Actinomadura rupiterrae TaxID=559627 RepID=UPI0020A5BC10|nr:MBL fold metallo-hydrolase [Actinomadura rupiterrae]MCP2336219.1 glyoxylase-like metal-dependent hydrolase (beta-lactamase superfamily II) [Actinomadura rupiterrae]
MRIRHLNCGTMRPFGGRLISGNGSVLGQARIVCHCLLLETDDGLVLVDTGLGTEDVRRPKALNPGIRTFVRPVLDEAETAVRQIERLGYRAEDVRHIVLTHLDFDHAGGLRDFPHAKVHVSATELDAAVRPATMLEKSRYHAPDWAHGPDWVAHEASGERWFGFSAVRDLPGLPSSILVVPLAGHTRGHTGVAVETSEGWLLHAGDAYFNRAQMAPAPSCPPLIGAFQVMLQADRAERLRNVARLNELARGGKVDVFCAHDEVEFDRAAAGTPAG